MNTVAAFLKTNWERLALDQFGSPSRLSCILATPRFRSSRHVIFLVLDEGVPDPVLVAKVPRLKGDHGCLDRERANLRAVQAVRPGGFRSIPRVVAYEDYVGSRILVESGLAGQPMNSKFVRRQPLTCLEVVCTWLINLHLETAKLSRETPDWFDRLVERPLRHFEYVFPLLPEEERLIENTRALARAVRLSEVPLVFEHGDLSSPNILVSHGGDAGVLDWELAEPRGLPAADLFFFLTYIAFARKDAKTQKGYLAAFDEAFFGKNAWVGPYVERYAERLQLSAEILRMLFVLCWSRYVTRLVVRLGGPGGGANGPLRHETADWLRQSRYFALWRHAVDHIDKVSLVN